ncbi:MAG TPA: hypothetical protein VGD65_03725 [Chryseosolibacter sp.]
MDSFKLLVVIALLFTGVLSANAQIEVDGKNVNDDTQVQYVQLLYYLEKGTLKPVYLIDHGLIDTQQGPLKPQKIRIDKIEVTASMSPVYILNLLHKAGWEYMGDETYVQVPMMEGWYSFTLKRKK